MAVMTPRPAQPTPGSGPPDSTHFTSPYPTLSTSPSSRSSTVPRSRTRSITVACALACRMRRVESALGSQPTIITFLPSEASPATVFCVVVDLPIPPLP